MPAQDPPQIPSPDETLRLYPLVSDGANRRLLVEWIQDQERYEVTDPGTPLSAAQFDLCILDAEAFRAHRAKLRERKEETAPVSLPYLLLFPDNKQSALTSENGRLTNDDIIDDVVFLPIRKAELAWRIRSLLRLRAQSRRLYRYNRLHQVYRTLNRCLVEADDRTTLLTNVVETLSDYDAFDRVIVTLVEDDSLEFDCGAGTAMSTGGLREYHSADRLKTATERGHLIREDVTGFTPQDDETAPHTEVELPIEYESQVLGALSVVYRPETASTDEEVELLAELAEDIAFAVYNVQLRVDHEEAIAQLTERNRQLKVIDRILRHNFHNKVNVIKGYSEMAETQAGEDVASYVENINDAVGRLIELVDKEHDITRTLSDPPAVKSFDIVAVVKSAVLKMKRKYPDAEIHTDLPQKCPVFASVGIGRAVEELIENGITYSEKTHPTVEVQVVSENNVVRVSISDDGAKIPEVEKQVYAGEADITQLSHGLGLGLRLVEVLVEQSDGDLQFAENEPQGSVVTMELATSDQ